MVVLPDGTPMVLGTLMNSEIDRIVHQNWSQVRTCYQNALSGSVPEFDTRLVLRFVISPEGNVAFADIPKVGEPNSQLTSCILGRVRTWNFPAPVGGSVVATRSLDFRINHH